MLLQCSVLLDLFYHGLPLQHSLIILFEPAFSVRHFQSLLLECDAPHVRTGDTSCEILHADTKYVAIADFFNFRTAPVYLQRRQLLGIDCLGIILAQHVALLIGRKEFKLIHWARVLDHSPVLQCLNDLVLTALINVVSEVAAEKLLNLLVVIDHEAFSYFEFIIAQRKHQLLL